MRSASDHPDVVDAYLSSELAARRVAGPFIIIIIIIVFIKILRYIRLSLQSKGN
jgi:hypothetical protein